MIDPALIEAAARALEDCWNNNRPTGAEPFPLSTGEALQAILTAVTPLIEAAALERVAQRIEADDEDYMMRNEVAAAIRALIPAKDQS